MAGTATRAALDSFRWTDPWTTAEAPDIDSGSDVSSVQEIIQDTSSVQEIRETDTRPEVAAHPRMEPRNDAGGFLERPENFNKPFPVLQTQRRIMMETDIQTNRSFDLYRIHSVRFELVDGDTLVFLDFPNAAASGQRQKADCHKIAYGSQEFRVHSQKLLATGSSKFAEMFNPTYQFRAQRRRRVVNKLPEGVKYVLDLTPPSEGDDLVFQVTELSLTPGIMKWWSSMLLHSIDSWLVGGHDDVCTCEMPLPRQQTDIPESLDTVEESSDNPQPDHAKPLLPPKPETLLQMKARGDTELYTTPSYRNIPDYCSIRHCNTIIRLLMLIEGRDIHLDSANRVWTLVAISKIFDCTSVVRDKVTQWLMHGTNTKFIEVLPEEALQLGFALELPEVTQSAFRILVNELALNETATEEALRRIPTRVTLFGRRQEDPGDELSNLVQHAATALIERITMSIQQFHNPDMFDYWNIEEWQKLRQLEQLLAQEDAEHSKDARLKLSRLMKALPHKITTKFDEAFLGEVIRNNTTYVSMDHDRATYVDAANFDTIAYVMALLNPTQKLLLPFVYSELASLWDYSLFTVREKSEHEESLKKTFTDLLVELEVSLQAFMDRSPHIRKSTAWDAFVAPALNEYTGRRLMNRFIKNPLVNLVAMETEVVRYLRPFVTSWIRHDIEPPLNLTRHMLLTLTNNEMKYLPLWAGGCNDGTGGVFESFLPPADMGPSGPGPAYHTGFTLPSTPSSVSGSLMDEISAMKIMGSTTAGSVDVNDSISTVYRPDEVIAEDVSIVSETFTAGGSEYQRAQFAIPAEHQPTGQAVDMLVESATDSESEAIMTDDESTTDGGSVAERSDAATVSQDDSRSEDSMVLV